MKNLIIVFTILCFFTSCKKENKKAANPNNNTPTNVATDDTKEEIEIDDTLVLSDEIADFLENKMPGYEIVPKEKWLSEEYLESMSKSMRPLYKDDILVEGDFNGDGEDDFATFLMDKKGKIKLFAFHKTASGYKKYELQKEGNSGFLGAGLDVEEPGFVYGGNKEVGLEYNGINYNIYEKTGTTFYYDSGRYRKVLTND
ncbi:MAG: hypothetical protein AB8F94_15830 [Saprospiraceae bacterium]